MRIGNKLPETSFFLKSCSESLFSTLHLCDANGNESIPYFFLCRLLNVSSFRYFIFHDLWHVLFRIGSSSVSHQDWRTWRGSRRLNRSASPLLVGRMSVAGLGDRELSKISVYKVFVEPECVPFWQSLPFEWPVEGRGACLWGDVLDAARLREKHAFRYQRWKMEPSVLSYV